MKPFVRRAIESYLARRGFQICSMGLFPTSATNKDDLQHFIQRLHPVFTGHELIRLGPKGDGGYLVPDDLQGIEACFSPGVSSISGFEKDCADLGMKVFMADHSVDRPADVHQRFHFTKQYVGVTTNDEFMTIDDWVRTSDLEPGSDLLLQIDIEGFEYEVFLSASDALMRRFRIIVAEFHSLDQLWNRPFFGLAGRTFDKILQTHTCIHLHPNNCCGEVTLESLSMPRVMEFTFLRNDRISRRTYRSTFPHPLDCDNTDQPTLALPACWYRNP